MLRALLASPLTWIAVGWSGILVGSDRSSPDVSTYCVRRSGGGSCESFPGLMIEFCTALASFPKLSDHNAELMLGLR